MLKIQCDRARVWYPLIGSHYAKREFSSSKWKTTFVPLNWVLFGYPCNFASRVPGKLWHQQFLIRGHSSHVRSFCCPCFFFPPMQMFLYILIPVCPNSWNFAVHKVSLRTSSTLCGACSFHLLPRDMPGSFLKTELFSASGFRAGGEELAVSFSDNSVFTQFLLHPHKLELWDLVHLPAGQAAPLHSVMHWPSD